MKIIIIFIVGLLLTLVGVFLFVDHSNEFLARFLMTAGIACEFIAIYLFVKKIILKKLI